MKGIKLFDRLTDKREDDALNLKIARRRVKSVSRRLAKDYATDLLKSILGKRENS